MPTLEIFASSLEAVLALERDVRARLAAEEFTADCVFVHRTGAVTAWSGDPVVFVRAGSRSLDRLARIAGALRGLCDVETIVVDYQPR